MKKRITPLIVLFIFSATLMWGQNTFTVTSNADSGEGSLRDIVADATDNDSIVIQDDINTIVLASEISTTKSLKINGQGATVKVTESKVSDYRPLEFVSPSSDPLVIINVALYNLTLIGGDISAASTTQEKNGGALYVKRASLKLFNCTLTGKAYDGGGLYSENSTTLYVDGCTFDACVVTHNHAATALGGFANGFTIKNSIISNNDATAAGGSSGIDISGVSGGTISNCIFMDNISKTGRGGAALSHRSKAQLKVENCLFEGNVNNGTDGGSAFTKQEADVASVCVFTNCTFYNNNGGRGAAYLYAGKSTFVNCSFAANKTISGADAKYGGGLYISGGSPIATLVNNILAYNYNSAGGTKDIYVSSATLDGTKNLLAVEQGVGSSLTSGVGFIYDMENRDNDSKLFANYTTADSKKIPILETLNGTLPLHANSVAKASGTTSYASVSIPVTDQRGIVRATTPCIGSYEYTTATGMNNASILDNVRIVGNQLIVNTETEALMTIYNVTGQVLAIAGLNRGENRLNLEIQGLIIIKIGNKTGKFMINY